MAMGDHLYVRRIGYTHHGIDVGDGRVIHYSGEPGKSKAQASIRYATMDQFARGATVHVRSYGRRLDADETVARAVSKLGECDYDLFGKNCEHFATWCVCDRHASAQVNGAAAAGGLGASTAAGAAAGVGVMSATGAAAGLSGAGVMSGLASAGGVVGGGAVAGLGVLGAGPGLVAAGIMHAALADDDSLSDDERRARGHGRHASLAGAVGGTVLGVSALSSAGSVAGLSAAGISSGLAGIGGVVGGGMVAGSALIMATPAVVAAGLGLLVYRLAASQRRRPPLVQLESASDDSSAESTEATGSTEPDGRQVEQLTCDRLHVPADAP